MWVGRPCPPVRNDIVTPRHLFLRRELIDDVGCYDGHLFFLALDPVNAFVYFPFYDDVTTRAH